MFAILSRLFSVVLRPWTSGPEILAALQQQEVTIMATADNTAATVIAEINDATNVVADRIQALINRTTLSPAQLDELTSIRDHLRGLGSDGANVVPVPAPAPTEPATPEVPPPPATDPSSGV